MARDGQRAAGATHDAVLARVRALIAGIRDGAAAAEEARTVPRETIDALLAAGIARILLPPRYGGYGLSLDTWFEVVREIGKADASHSWCASLMIHHPHYLGQFPEAAQQAVWADGTDVSIAASIQPIGRVTPAEGGYRVSGEFPFASGINHSRWIIVGCLVDTEAKFFLIGPKHFKIKDTWFTGAMRATGSNTAVCDDVYVPESHCLALSDVREGKTPGARLHDHPIYRAPWVSYAPLTFATPMLGAAQGAYELFRDWTKTCTPAGAVSPSRRSRASRCVWRARPLILTLPNCCCAARSMSPAGRRRRRRRCVRGRCAIVRVRLNYASASSTR